MDRGSVLWGLFISILIMVLIGGIVIVFTFGQASVIADLRVSTDKAFRNVYVLENSAYELLYNSENILKSQEALDKSYEDAVQSLEQLAFHSGLQYLDPIFQDQLQQTKKLWTYTTNGFNTGSSFLTEFLDSDHPVNDTTNLTSMLNQLSLQNTAEADKYAIELYTLEQAGKSIKTATGDLVLFATATMNDLENDIVIESNKINNLKVSIAWIVSTILGVLILAAFMKSLQILRNANIDLEKQVKDRTKSIRDLLDYSGEGFLSFGPDFIVNPELSQECISIFGRSIAGESFTRVLFSSEQLREDFSDALALVFSGTSDPEVVFEFIDSKIELNEKIIKLNFHLVDDSTIMCQLLDITENEILQKTLEEENAQSRMILRAVSSKRDFMDLLEEAESLFATLEGCISEGNYCVEVTENDGIIRAVHTFKANAAFLRMQKTVESAHNLETTLIEYGILSDSTPLGPEMLAFREAFKQEIQYITDILGRDWLMSADSIEVNLEKLEETRNFIQTNYPDDESLRLKMNQLASLQLSSLNTRLSDLTYQLAKNNGKRVEVITEINDIFVTPGLFKRLSDSINHILRNMITHGIEFPKHREKAGKPQEGRISISAVQKDGHLEMQLSDDGAGLSVPKIKEYAIKTGKIPANNTTLTQQDYVKMIFQPGFSTAETITAVSGRGYGLSAVRESIYEIGGKIKVSTSKGRGTKFIIVVPNHEKELV